MTEKFLLDENVLVSAETLRDANGNDDYSSHKLIADIVYNCHSIVIDKALEHKYYKKFEQLQHDSRGIRSPSVVRLMTSLLSNSSKLIRKEFVPPLKSDSDVPPDDREIVRLAIFTRSILVTRDERLIEHGNSSNLKNEYEFRIVRPAEAIKMAGGTKTQ